jgi:RNA polymerase sigma factor (sigma-70 family)
MDDDPEAHSPRPQGFPDWFQDPRAAKKWWKVQAAMAQGHLRSVSRQYARYGKEKAVEAIELEVVMSLACQQVAEGVSTGHAWDGVSDFDTFFTKCVRRSIISEADKNWRSLNRFDDSKDVDQLHVADEGLLEQEARVSREDLQRRLDYATARTKWGASMKKYAQNLFRFDGLSQQEIGKKTGLSPESLSQYRTRIARSETFLRAARGEDRSASVRYRRSRGSK